MGDAGYVDAIVSDIWKIADTLGWAEKGDDKIEIVYIEVEQGASLTSGVKGGRYVVMQIAVIA